MVDLIQFVLRLMIILSWPNCISLSLAVSFLPTLLRSTYEPCWSSVALFREWFKGVLIDGHGLWNVIWPTDRKSVRHPRFEEFSMLKFWRVSDPIDGCVEQIVGHSTVCRCHRWLHLQISFCIACFWSVLATGRYNLKLSLFVIES